jgi:SsrA-binding protein
VPLVLFISKKGFAKLEIAIGKGKKYHDKRESLKDKDIKREIDRFS